MKHLLRFILVFCVLGTFNSYAQNFPEIGNLDPSVPVSVLCAIQSSTPITVPVTSDPRDQIVQGPCYIFATVAALESRAAQSCINMDFHEWSLFNSCVLGSGTDDGHTMITRVVDVALDEGVISSANNPKPLSEADLPNPTSGTKGIGFFSCATYCDDSASNRVYIHQLTTDEGCADIDPDTDRIFNVYEPGSYETRYQVVADPNPPAYPPNIPTPSGFPGSLPPLSPGVSVNLKHINLAGLSNHQKAQVLMALLGQGYGCISLFDNWQGALDHCVFIYGGDGCNWMYKDSWPGDAGLKSEYLNLVNLTRIYYIKGLVKEKDATCGTYTIVGDESQNPITYTVQGPANTGCNYVWSATEGTILSGQGTESISFNASNCANSEITISVEITSPSGVCSTQTTIQKPAATSSLFVQGTYWQDVLNIACPDESFIAQTNNMPKAYYDWVVDGAQIQNGSNTHEIQFKTPDIPSGDLEIKVRSMNACGTNPYTTLEGTVDANGVLCDGGIFRMKQPSTSGLQIMNREIKWGGQDVSEAKSQGPSQLVLIDMNGRVVMRRMLGENSERIYLNELPAGVYVLGLEGKEVMLREKIMLR